MTHAMPGGKKGPRAGNERLFGAVAGMRGQPTILRVRLRGIGAVATLLLAVGGCDFPDDAQFVEVVAGGGESDGGVAADAAIDGRLVDMVMGSGGVLHVLTAEDLKLTMWTVADGRLSHVPVAGLKPEQISQVTTGPDGEVLVGLWDGAGGVWEIRSDGSAGRTLGAGTARAKLAADGVTREKAEIRAVRGVAVDPGGDVYFAEQRSEPVTHDLVRTFGTGKLKTVFGRDLAGLKEAEWAQARTLTGFPDGTPGTKVAAADNVLTMPLAVAPDGNVYVAATRRSVVVVRRDGTAHKVLGADVDRSSPPEWPFQDRGAATEASVDVVGAGMVTDNANNVYLVGISDRYSSLPESFDWTGDVTDKQRELLIRSKEQRERETEVLRVRPDGELATVAGHADAVAVDQGWIYLARSFKDKELADRVIVVRTAEDF
ncbi:hypothetical protein Ahu01nite_082930 [Winogradskya humida]|uniref:Lipoprotein n=1 Tax=Winogradskya humida TaxID=113566 RepID=A0ABQ4A2W1_9ACTN|nr:hypothetical protein Ahu01nite_082930 [Actinoplanes humidus]